MIWFFERSGQEMRVVTRFDRGTTEYVVEVEWPGRAPETERFTDYHAFNQRVQRLHQELQESRWTQAGMPGLLSDGWRGPISGN